MWALRLILLALGALFIAGLYLYTRRHPPRRARNPDRLRDPGLGALRGTGTAAPAVPAPEGARNGSSGGSSGAPADAELAVFSLALRLPGEGLPAEAVAAALARLGCVAGDGIYHAAGSRGEPVYHVADLFEPGVLAPLPHDRRLRGLAFFFQARPGGESGERFDRMLGAVRECARALEGRIEDPAHRPLTAARELEMKLSASGARNPS